MVVRTDFKVNDLGYIEFENGDLSVVTDYDQVRQHIQQRLSTFKGEWIFNSDEGVPYMQYVFVDNPDYSVISTILKRTILGTPGVESITNFNMTFDKKSRRLSVTFIANGRSTLDNVEVQL